MSSTAYRRGLVVDILCPAACKHPERISMLVAERLSEDTLMGRWQPTDADHRAIIRTLRAKTRKA